MKRILLVFTILAFLSCNKQEDPEPTLRTIEDVEEDFIALDYSEGIHDYSLKYLNSVYWDFRLIAPENSSNQKKPLIISFHGGGGFNPSAHQATECFVEPGLQWLDGYIISPNSSGEEWFSDNNRFKINTLLDFALEHWPIDDSKVLATGFSNGGNATWYYLETQPESFTAGIALETSYDISNLDNPADSVGRKIESPLYVIHSSTDELFPLEVTQNWVEMSQRAGSNIKFVVVDSLSHYDVCSYMNYYQDAARWVRDTIW